MLIDPLINHTSSLIAQAPSLDDVVGHIDTPPGVQEQIDKAVSTGAISAGDNALIYFLSNMLKFGAIFMGIWVIFNILMAAYDFINNKDTSAGQEKAKNRLTMSVMGLLLIVVAYTATGLISYIFFGDAGYILNPEF